MRIIIVIICKINLRACMDYRSRKSNRIPEYDYSQVGAYFVTICSHNRKHIFGNIVGDAACKDAKHPVSVPHCELSKHGKIVNKYINNISTANPNVSVDCYVIMPNHVHLLLCIHRQHNNGTPRAASPTKSVLAKTINALKGLATKEAGVPLWQRSFHEHVVRDEKDYLRIWQYIENNPHNWHNDEYYPQ